MPHKRLLSFGLATIAILSRVGCFITGPLWLDHFKSNASSPDNSTDHQVTAGFLLFSQWSSTAVVFGVTLLPCLIFIPGFFAGCREKYSLKSFAIIGISQGISSVLFNFALSGSRTAPYLQAILANFTIPIQFITRFVLLRRRPSCLKLACAIIVSVAEVLCLIPSIFPSLEDAHAHSQEGGSTGAGRFLWPLCFVLSQVPFAVANALMERSVKRGQTDDEARRSSFVDELSLTYFLFCWSSVVTLTVTCVLWLDIVPGFGTSMSPEGFAENFAFGFKCIFGGGGCSSSSALLGWSNYLSNIVGCFAFAALMRFSEGANFTIIALTLRTPLVFLFWTLFTEDPFHYEPHVHLSTWLSIAGIVIMLPAIVIYDLAPKEISSSESPTETTEDDRQTLIACNADVDFEDSNSVN